MTDKCKKCFWYFSIRDHRGKVWTRACWHAIDGLLDGRDIQPTEDCFEARKRRQKPELEMKDFRELLKEFSTKMSAFIGHAAGAAPSVTFEAAEGEALNISGKENNPMVDALVQAIKNQ